MVATKTKKDAAIKTAAKAAAALKKKPQVVQQKIRRNVRFFRPKTLTTRRNPRIPNRAVQSIPRVDDYSILRTPLTTEKAMTMIEELNTLVFLCDPRANKKQIAKAVQDLYKTSVARVNTLIRPDGVKKAFVRLSPGEDALDVANRIGMI